VGEARTDALGYYRIEYTAAAIDERDQNPETFIEVLDDEGEVLFTSTKSFIQKAGQSAFIPAAVDGGKLPTSQRLANKVAGSVARRQRDLARRGRILKHQSRVEVVRRGGARGDDGRGNDSREDAAPHPEPRVEQADAPVKKIEARAGKARRRGQTGSESKSATESKQQAGAGSAKQRPVASSHSLRDVKGIGSVYQKRLADAGITDIETVAALQPSQLASVLGAGTGRAERIIHAAQAVARPEQSGDQS
jgi:predicted flap endonuclease-1-like 5' DNA nuclease